MVGESSGWIIERVSRNSSEGNMRDHRSICDCQKQKAVESRMGQGLAGRCGQWRPKQSKELFEGQEGRHENELL